MFLLDSFQQNTNLGGFFLPQLGAWMKSTSGSPYAQVIPMATLALIAGLVQYRAIRRVPAETYSIAGPAVG